MPLPSIPDYNSCIKNPAMVHPTVLAGGHPIVKGRHIVKYAGGFCVVFPYQTPTAKYAVRCWHAEVSDAKRRTQLVAAAIKDAGLPYFVGFDFHEDGIMTPQGLQPIVVMDWVDAQPLKAFIAEHINETAVISELADRFKQMVTDLHGCHFSHGDLQHGNIMVRRDRSLVLVDYDSMYVPTLQGMADEIKGLVGYQHPARQQNKLATERADYFSELVIYTSLKALAKMPHLWRELNMADTETMLFSAEDIRSPGSAKIFKQLKHDADIAPLVDKLCEFVSARSIDNLEPLEKAVVKQSESISAKWAGGNGYDPSEHKGKVADASSITSKWHCGNGYCPPDPAEQQRQQVLQITQKIKKG